MDIKLSVVIPAYNEEKRIGETLDQLTEYFSKQDYEAEIIVVNDGSVDNTKKVVEEKNIPYLNFIENDQNRGKGYTVKHGVSKAKGQHVLFFDADASTPIDQVEKFWPEFESGAQICIGSRSLPDSDIAVRQPWYRETMGRIFNLFVQTITVKGIIDTQCGFKAFTSRAAEVIFPRQTLSGFGFDVELLFIGRKFDMKIAEVPVRWINSPESKVNPITDASKMFLELVSIRFKDIFGRYR